ncbi:MAG TPA: glycosyltransferase family 4 protein [Methylomirabilota bacterium]|nr:glycosyltransferase family 4 protein [Methylomirabilota bacterium]
MRIAFISHEFPPDTDHGGIGNYVLRASAMLTDRGHTVEIFAGSGTRDGTFTEGGILVHRVRDMRSELFSKAVAGVFRQRHRELPFDVMESPEYCFEGLEAARQSPDLPLVVKLHTPSMLLAELSGGFPAPTFLNTLKGHGQQLRAFAGAIRHRRPLPRWHWNRHAFQSAMEFDAVERTLAQMADVVASPSAALLEMMAVRWDMNRENLMHVPSYVPPPRLLAVPIETATNVVSYFGRLETRKGVDDLATAIPLVLAEFPNARFRFVGRIGSAPDGRRDFKTYIQDIVGNWRDKVEFTGFLPIEKMYDCYSLTDICVFPSRWENAPNVCLEAMAAGRGVIGSSAGGMAEMLDGGKVGLLVQPHSPAEIAAAILQLLRNPAERMRLGALARQRILSEYNKDKIIASLEKSYTLAIQRHSSAKRITNAED